MPVDRRRSSYLLSPSDRSRRISTAQRSPSASSTPAIEHAIPSKLLDRIDVSLQVTPITRVIQLPAPPKLPDRTKNACLPLTLIIRVIKPSSTGDCRNGLAEDHETNEPSRVEATDMSELRDLVLDAHGGIARWRKLKTIEGDMSITGALWARKGWSDVLRDVHVTADVWGQMVSYQSFTDPGMRSVYRPDYAAVETSDGKLIKDRRNPRAAFDGHTVETKSGSRLFQRLRDLELPQFAVSLPAARSRDGRDRTV